MDVAIDWVPVWTHPLEVVALTNIIGSFELDIGMTGA